MKPVTLAMLLCLATGCAHPAWAQRASARDAFVGALEGASQIRISYIPNRVFDRPLTRDDINRNWDVQTTVRCTSACSRAAPQLMAFLRDSLDVVNDCPVDYRLVIEARDRQGQLVATAWGDSSWRCVQTESGAFVLNGNGRSFLNSNWPPPLD